MNKTFKKLSMLMAAVAMTAVFAACSDDDKYSISQAEVDLDRTEVGQLSPSSSVIPFNLVTDKDASGRIKPFVDGIEQQIMFAEKSWWRYQVLDVQPRALTLKVTLQAGQQMSYHLHERRDEVWIVISGEGETLVDGMKQTIRPGDVITILAGCKHRVRAHSELTLIEVQLGEGISVHDKKKFAE